MSLTTTMTTGSATSTQTLGFLHVRTVRGAARCVLHAPEDDAATEPAEPTEPTEPYVLLGIHSLGRATLVRRGSAEACLPGDLFACDGAEPFVLEEEGDFELHLVRIPRRALTLTDRQVRELGGRAPFTDGTVASLLGPLLRDITGLRPGHAPRTALRLAGAVADLVGLLVAEDAVSGPQDGGQDREALMARLRAYVDANLWDRNLTPASVAESQHISIRYLHKLFEGRGSTVGRWIQHRRLEEARRELARPGRDDITVSAVARRWGFASATHFSRSFRAAYGMSPSDWRDGRTTPV
ncbi:AraC family transcriptional regulator [Streptomyces sp. NPDC029674]|uniref:helix-turn-helix transcriptional regulator n=1 Tax=Streptomyces sp. NPDC029674 TaxID=3365297 RepID=UPI00384AB52B